MEKDSDKSGKANKTSLRGFARIKLSNFESSEDEDILEDEDMNNKTSSWIIPTREERDLILAEEIIRFASIIDRPPTTSKITRVIEDVTDSNNMVGKSDKEVTPTANGATSRTIHTASEAGMSGSVPPQSASNCLTKSACSFQDTFYPVGASPRSLQLSVFKPDTMPVTKHIFTATVQDELEHYSSNDHANLQPINYTKNIQRRETTVQTNRLLAISNSPIEEWLTRVRELKLIKKELQMGNSDCAQANKEKQFKGENDGMNINPGDEIGTPPANALDNSYNQPFVEIPRENDFQLFQDNNLNDNNAGAPSVTDDNEATQSELPEEDNSSGVEWTRTEKRRLGIVIRDLSREMKTKELQNRKASLLRKGRIIAKAIDSTICEINREITAVYKKPLRHIALPLDQYQEYDWVKVASALNAKRSPKECRTFWKYYLHPAINASEWRVTTPATGTTSQRKSTLGEAAFSPTRFIVNTSDPIQTSTARKK